MKYLFSLILIIITSVLTFILTPRPYQAHYHANFAVYIDGVRKDFSGDSYMEEVSRCNITTDVQPQDRIHLHDNKWWLVHVHMAASTWWDLFNNLFHGIGKGYFVDAYGNIYQSGSGKSLIYILNGKEIDNPANIPVKSEDRLLVWYGTGKVPEVLERFDSLVEKDAHEYNQKDDPASCSSNTYGSFLWNITEKIKEYLPHIHDE